MLKVGLTGGLASGKTHVARLLENLGCHVVQADRLGHEVLRRGGEAYDDVLREFGPHILSPDGEVDRKALGKIVFANPARLATLNSLVHPHVFRRQQEFFERVERNDAHGIAVVEAAIMIESGSHKRYDRLLLTVCPPEMQIRRFMERDGATEEEARRRLERQMPLEEKREFADYVIDTSGTKEETERQVREVLDALKAEAA
jgi:dephospho-CoA kinase